MRWFSEASYQNEILWDKEVFETFVIIAKDRRIRHFELVKKLENPNQVKLSQIITKLEYYGLIKIQHSVLTELKLYYLTADGLHTFHSF